MGDAYSDKCLIYNSLVNYLSVIFDDDEFNLYLYELGNGPINFDLDCLSTLHFNPLLSSCGQRLALSTDIDPDSNFYFDQLNCGYFTESKLMR